MFLFICTIGKKHIITDSVKMDNNIYYSGESEYRNQEQRNNVTESHDYVGGAADNTIWLLPFWYCLHQN